MRGLLVAAALTLLAASPVAGAAAPKHVLFPGCSDAERPMYKPRTILIACADASLAIERVHWSRWSRRSAKGSGTVEQNSCEPNCAEGHFNSYAVKISLAKARSCPHHRREFRQLVYRFTQAKPQRARQVNTVALPCG